MAIVYFGLCMLGGAFIVLIPWMGMMLAIFNGQPKTAREGAIQATKQASEHPHHAGALVRDERAKQTGEQR